MSDPVAKLPPYAEGLGIRIERNEGAAPLLAVDFSPRVRGRPGFLHGGAMSGLMEMAAFAALQAELARRGEQVRIKPVNIQVEFMRGGIEQVTYALGSVTRAGRRVALVNAEAFQDDRTRPIALAQMKFLLIPAE